MELKKLKSYHQWTKDQIKKVLKMWESHTAQEIAEEIGVSKEKITGIANVLRKKGFKLSKKRQNGYFQILIDELKQEMKIK